MAKREYFYIKVEFPREGNSRLRDRLMDLIADQVFELEATVPQYFPSDRDWDVEIASSVEERDEDA